jgi:hypothetical protein
MARDYTRQEILSRIPPGNPDGWTEDQWNSIDGITESMGLSVSQEAMLWEEVVSRMGDDPFTDDAYLKVVPNLDDEEAEGVWVPVSEAAEIQEATAIVPKCTCDGPPNGKYTTHTNVCPACPPEQRTQYQGYKVCTHVRDPFDIGSGVLVYASAARDAKDYDPDLVKYGIYASSDWIPDIMMSPGFIVPWAERLSIPINTVKLDWPDYKTPTLPIELLQDVLEWAVQEAATGVGVEVGCMGGHGRTGTMLALLAVTNGADPITAHECVKQLYCKHAIESESQAKYIGRYYNVMTGAGDKEYVPDNKAVRKGWNKILKSYAPKYTKPVGYMTTKTTGGGTKSQDSKYFDKKEAQWWEYDAKKGWF